MKLSKNLIVPLIASILTLEQASAIPRFKGKDPTVSTHSSSGGATRPYQSKPAADAGLAGIECDPGNSVTYGFIDSITGGEPIDVKKDGSNLIVSIPEYFSACISKLKLESKIGSDNNVYFKFAVEPTTELRTSTGNSFERKYEVCVDDMIKANPTIVDSDGTINYDEADKLGLVARNKFRVAVDVSAVDSSKDSEVIVASIDKTALFNSAVYNSTPSGLGDSSEKSWNCMRFETPNSATVRVYQTDRTRLIDQAEAICKSDNASLHDVEAIRAELLKSETLGNFSPLIRSLSKLKYSLLKQEIDEISKQLDTIEDKFEPSDEDLEEGRKIGVSKTEAKNLGKKYEELMKKFNDEFLPQIKSDLAILLSEREDANEARIDEIDKEISKLSELLTVFDRETTERGDKFVLLMRGMKEANLKSATKEIFNAIYAAKHFKSVYEGDADERGPKLSLKQAEEKSRQMAKDKYQQTASLWDDERELKSGSDAPIKRRQRVLADINRKGQQEKLQFSQKFNSQDKYIQQYLQRAQQTYCTSGGDMQKCQYVTQQLAPTIYNQYGQYKQQQASQFQNQWTQKYGSAIQQQQNLIGNYQSMNEQYKMEMLRKQMTNNVYTGYGSTGSDYDYSFFDSNYGGGSGLDFLNGMDFNGSMNGGNNQFMNMPMSPQMNNRAPAGGNTNFSNPYQIR